MKRTFYLNMLGIVFFLISPLTFGQTLNIKDGAKYQATSTAKSNTSMNFMGRSMTVNSTVNTAYAIKVEGKKDGNYLLTNRITRIATTAKNSMMGRVVSIDSDNPDDLKGKQGDVIRNLLNSDIKVTLSPKGKVLNVDLDTTKMNAELLKTINGYGGKKGFGSNMVFLALPKNLSVGKSWQENSSAKGIQSTTTYTVKSIDGKLVTLDVSGKVSITKTVQKNGVSSTVNFSGTFSGETVVNKKTNVIQHSSKKLDMKGTTQVMGKEIPMSVSSEVHTKVKAL